MGLFDFLDLNGETGAWDTLSQTTQGVMQGRRQGYEDAMNREVALQKIIQGQQDYKIKSLELENKLRRQPIDDLLLMQKVNIPTSEPTEDHYLKAGQEIFGEDRSLWPKGEEVTPGMKAAVQAKAAALAKAETPPMNPYDMENWLRANSENVISDLANERIKAREQMDVLLMKEANKDRRTKELFDFRDDQKTKDQNFKTKEKSKDRNFMAGENAKKAAERDAARNEKSAEAIAKKWKVDKGRYYRNITKDPDGMAAFAQAYSAMRSANAPKALDTFEKTYATEIAALSSRPKSGPGMGRFAGAAKVKPLKRGIKYSDGDLVLFPDGTTKTYRGGKFK